MDILDQIAKLIEAGDSHEAVVTALALARDASFEHQPKEWLSNVGKFRSRLEAAIKALNRISAETH